MRLRSYKNHLLRMCQRRISTLRRAHWLRSSLRRSSQYLRMACQCHLRHRRLQLTAGTNSRPNLFTSAAKVGEMRPRIRRNHGLTASVKGARAGHNIRFGLLNSAGRSFWPLIVKGSTLAGQQTRDGGTRHARRSSQPPLREITLTHGFM